MIVKTLFKAFNAFCFQAPPKSTPNSVELNSKFYSFYLYNSYLLIVIQNFFKRQ